MAFVRGFFAAIRRDLTQRRCRVCGVPVSARPDRPNRTDRASPGWPPSRLCPACAGELAPRQGGYCPRCGAMAADPAAEPHLCAACLFAPRPFASLAFHAPYGGLLRNMIVSFKFGERPEHVAVLRDLLLAAFERAAARPSGQAGERIAPGATDLVVPVPLHPGRLSWRGFNQSLELARPLAGKYGWPLEPAALARIRRTRPQSTLSGRERRENIRGAFAADPLLVRGRAVLLTDDVMTTGATVDAAAQALLAAGARRVDVVVLAR